MNSQIPVQFLSLITEMNFYSVFVLLIQVNSQNHSSSFGSYGLLVLGMELWLMIPFLYLVVNETNCFKNKQIPLGKKARAEPWKTCPGTLLTLATRTSLGGHWPGWPSWTEAMWHTHVGQDDFYRLRAFATKWNTVYFPSVSGSFQFEPKIRSLHIQVWRSMVPTLSIHATSL